MKTEKYICLLVWGMLACSCTEEQDSVTAQQGGDNPIVLSASVNNNGQADSRVESGEIEEGQYYLTYTDTNNEQQVLSAIFTSGVGYPYIYDTEGTGTPLKWEGVKNISGKSTLTLDNVQNQINVTDVPLGDAYKAANAQEDKNDIVWGKTEATWNTADPVIFTLQHRMASVKVNIDVAEGLNSIEDEVEKGVTVSLLKIRTTPSTFNRNTGVVSVINSEIEKETEVTIHTGVLSDNGDTDTWIFPPLNFNDGRPQLQIKLNNGTTYTGTIPETMLSGEGPSEGNDATSRTLAFEAGKLLTIRVLLVEDVKDQPILFLPARVENWEDKGPVSIECNQLGIYNEEDYETVVAAYNTKEELTLKRYATYDNGIWTIRIFASFGEGANLNENLKFDNDGQLNLQLNSHTVYGQKTYENLIKSSTDEGDTSTPPTEGNDGNTENDNESEKEEAQ